MCEPSGSNELSSESAPPPIPDRKLHSMTDYVTVRVDQAIANLIHAPDRSQAKMAVPRVARSSAQTV
jgi:hypothetical protein